jgi:ribosomal protein L29
MKTMVELAKDMLPKKLHGLVDTYGMAFVRVKQAEVVELAQLLAERKTRQFKEKAVLTMDRVERMQLLETERRRMARLRAEYHNIRQARVAFWDELTRIGLALLTGYMTQITGVPQ